ncbi:hypothetical protein ACJMK2_032618 [Sinanodonta woodiana]|uniref:G-protein coupled receptors family 1 profile domain-containing protein n=1 Tax=Sinanodonta woodiana TaxID=1069815 RepID=A0ABD3X2A7_SINWO
MNSSMKCQPSDRNRTTEEIKDEYFKVIFPVVGFSVFAMTVGTLGNCLVLYIFKFKCKQSNHRYFIKCLAACDFTGSLIGIPFMIVAMTLTYDYDSVICKISRFLNHLFGFCSGFIIMLIAIERYLKICKAKGKQMSYNMARNVLYASSVLGILFSLPSAFLYGHNYVQTDIHNVSKRNYHDTSFPLMYHAFLVLWFIVAMITVCACYIQIVCTIRAWNAAQNIICQYTRVNNSLASSDVSSISNQPTRTRTVISNWKSKSAIQAYRLEKMLFIVAASFFCSYIPYLGISLVNIVKTDFMQCLSPMDTVVTAVCMKSFLVNYFVNPIVYGFFDRALRAECQKLFYRIIRRR